MQNPILDFNIYLGNISFFSILHKIEKTTVLAALVQKEIAAFAGRLLFNNVKFQLFEQIVESVKLCVKLFLIFFVVFVITF